MGFNLFALTYVEPYDGHINNKLSPVSLDGNGFVLTSNRVVSVKLSQSENSIVKTALSILEKDLYSVLSSSLVIGDDEDIIIGTLGKNKSIENIGVDLSSLNEKKQAFVMAVVPDGRLLIAGSDSHGTAYGIMELSRLLGVSPWEWWADVIPDKRTSFELPYGYYDCQYPSVEYRGIFINDEDWGLMPWSSLNYEKTSVQGQIGPKTNERIFELLLRLRANTYWPAMHECTYPFFMTEGNLETAKKYGIYVGGSHCEPMACSTAGEWPLRGVGEYDYVNNSHSVNNFWKERIMEVANQEILYTLGMRGVHDGKMMGAKTVEEQKTVLEKVIFTQRRMLSDYVNKNLGNVPQVFIPYKEVLDIYNSGLDVPDDVTLMWCDDNYGYIRHFPTDEERIRKGGNGIYYHISYWGRPHDYLWLGTFSPFLLYQQMKLAYERGIRKIWILNVGDIKPAEYQIELFMDMAWNIDNVSNIGVSSHLYNFLEREFGGTVAKGLLPILKEHYRLAYIRKPEFMGNTRVEEYNNKTYYNTVKDLDWDKDYLEERVSNYEQISFKVDSIKQYIPVRLKDAYYQLAEYPVKSAAEMNKKFIYAQLARHGLMDWKRSDNAYDSIVSLTSLYNKGINNNYKWDKIMDAHPRKLPVFNRVEHSYSDKELIEGKKELYKLNATDFKGNNIVVYDGLGYDTCAALIPKDSCIEYKFDDIVSDSIDIELCLLPSHPVEGDFLRISVSFDGVETLPIHYETKGRSEEWKQNVLRNQARKMISVPVNKDTNHSLKIKALDDGVILDRVVIYEKLK